MFLVLLFLTLCLHAVDCPWWQPRTGVMTHGGGAARPRAPASCRAHPVPVAVETAAVLAPAPPPWGGTGDRTPEQAGGCPYATAHEGAPVRGDGPRSSLGVGCSPGSGEGPHTAVGGWRYYRGHSRRGAAAPPPTGCNRRGSRRNPPPRGEQGRGGRAGGEHCLLGERQ